MVWKEDNETEYFHLDFITMQSVYKIVLGQFKLFPVDISQSQIYHIKNTDASITFTFFFQCVCVCVCLWLFLCAHTLH